jgi:DNA-directed RNA polymerase specialized sigma24 family protein
MEPEPPTPPPTRDEVYQQLLAVRCQLGERAAMVELVRAWERPLLFYVRRLVSGEDEALNVMQEVWLRVFTGLISLRDPGRLAPWLYTIARHTLMDRSRSPSRRACRRERASRSRSSASSA